MILAVAGGFDQLVHDMVRRRLIGIAHAEINDVLALMTRLQLERLDLRKHIRRKPIYAVKPLHPSLNVPDRLAGQGYPPPQKATGANPWMNASQVTLRSLGEGGYASAGSAEVKWRRHGCPAFVAEA